MAQEYIVIQLIYVRVPARAVSLYGTTKQLKFQILHIEQDVYIVKKNVKLKLKELNNLLHGMILQKG